MSHPHSPNSAKHKCCRALTNTLTDSDMKTLVIYSTAVKNQQENIQQCCAVITKYGAVITREKGKLKLQLAITSNHREHIYSTLAHYRWHWQQYWCKFYHDETRWKGF